MAKAKAGRAAQARRYPQPVKIRSGCKVHWEYFATKKDAEAAAKVARADGERYARLGYDYGFMCPGAIKGPQHAASGSEYAGLFEVCFP